MDFYSYLWLRADGTPYYAGKGKGNRAFVRASHRLRPPDDHSRILVFPMASEAEAFESEIALIELFGREDLGKGRLLNLTDGGENPPSWKGRKRLSPTPEHRLKISQANKGRSVWNKGVSPSDATRKKISLTLQGCQNALGHKCSEDVRRQMSLRLKGKPSLRKGQKCSEETRQKMSAAKQGHSPWNKGRPTLDSVRQKQRLAALARRVREREQL